MTPKHVGNSQIQADVVRSYSVVLKHLRVYVLLIRSDFEGCSVGY